MFFETSAKNDEKNLENALNDNSSIKLNLENHKKKKKKNCICKL